MNKEKIKIGSQKFGVMLRQFGNILIALLSSIGKAAANGFLNLGSRISKLINKGDDMGMKRCPSGHYFDSSKSSTCPLCGAEVEQSAPENKENKLNAPISASGGEPQRLGHQTVGFMVKEKGFDPVVGWLVAIEGPDRGKDFRIRAERNFIGRSPGMDIIVNDDAVSRENHATISFNPTKHTFKLQPGQSRGLIYLNGEEVAAPENLSKGDKIKIGTTELLFVPFVDEFHTWK